MYGGTGRACLRLLGLHLGGLDAHIMTQPHAVAASFSSGLLSHTYIPYVLDDKPRAESGMVIAPIAHVFSLTIAAYIWYFDHSGNLIA